MVLKDGAGAVQGTGAVNSAGSERQHCQWRWLKRMVLALALALAQCRKPALPIVLALEDSAVNGAGRWHWRLKTALIWQYEMIRINPFFLTVWLAAFAFPSLPHRRYMPIRQIDSSAVRHLIDSDKALIVEISRPVLTAVAGLNGSFNDLGSMPVDDLNVRGKGS